MARIVFATFGSLGDLHPLIAIAFEMKRRGHEVDFCTSQTYRSKLEGLGFGFHSMRPDVTPENGEGRDLVKKIFDPRRGAEHLICGVLLPYLRESYEDLRNAITQPRKADLLICGELVYAAPIVAEELGLAWATYVTTPMSFFSAFDLPILPPVPRLSAVIRKLGSTVAGGALRLVKSTTRNWGRPVRQLRAELRLSPGGDPVYEGKFSPHLVLAGFSGVLAKPQPDWPMNTVLTGFPFYDGSTEQESLPRELNDFLENGEAPIVFTLGSSAVMDPGTFYEESIKAARRLKKRAVLLIGQNAPAVDAFEDVIAVNYVAFSKLFPRAAAIVHQGGIGTTGQALRAGKAMLVMPFAFDQQDNAARVVRLGAGRTISRRRYTSESAARELGLLLETPGYRAAAVEAAARISKEDGASAAANALVKLPKIGR
ncbi:MAG TPA: glycosyltransferase [Verrucomicrobiae bacterium]|nr:glycosyltransferase [Verrucomicrobiae bacterium]